MDTAGYQPIERALLRPLTGFCFAASSRNRKAHSSSVLSAIDRKAQSIINNEQTQTLVIQQTAHGNTNCYQFSVPSQLSSNRNRNLDTSVFSAG